MSDTAIQSSKVCAACGVEKPLSEYSPSTRKYRRPHSYCKECMKVKSRESQRRHKAKDPVAYKEREWRNHIRKTFGLSFDDFCEMYDRQMQVCAICGEHPELRLSVDHCHATGAVRGLLCRQCNASLGGFKESIEFLEAAIDYLKRTSQTGPAANPA